MPVSRLFVLGIGLALVLASSTAMADDVWTEKDQAELLQEQRNREEAARGTRTEPEEVTEAVSEDPEEIQTDTPEEADGDDREDRDDGGCMAAAINPTTLLSVGLGVGLLFGLRRSND